jgi:hypothetical protein
MSRQWLVPSISRSLPWFSSLSAVSSLFPSYVDGTSPPSGLLSAYPHDSTSARPRIAHCMLNEKYICIHYTTVVCHFFVQYIAGLIVISTVILYPHPTSNSYPLSTTKYHNELRLQWWNWNNFASWIVPLYIIHIRAGHVPFLILIGRNSVAEWLIVASTYHFNSDPKWPALLILWVWLWLQSVLYKICG